MYQHVPTYDPLQEDLPPSLLESSCCSSSAMSNILSKFSNFEVKISCILAAKSDNLEGVGIEILRATLQICKRLRKQVCQKPCYHIVNGQEMLCTRGAWFYPQLNRRRKGYHFFTAQSASTVLRCIIFFPMSLSRQFELTNGSQYWGYNMIQLLQPLRHYLNKAIEVLRFLPYLNHSTLVPRHACMVRSASAMFLLR